jgi:hypothetical protein
MYILRALQELGGRSTGVNVEYRLACSGEFYRHGVLTGDWRKSDVTRLLLDEPFPMFVVSRPFEEFPQELCIRFSINRVTESDGNFSRSILPDVEVVDDLCALLTLLSRRLITRVVKTREKLDDPHSTKWYQSELPMPVVSHPQVVAWRRNPNTPVAVDSLSLTQFLTKLPSLPHAQEIVHAARLYKYALESIEDRPDTAYLALISVIESLSNVAYSTFEPSDADKISTKPLVVKLAKKLGLDDAQANALALEACKGDYWVSRKFKKFCAEYCPVEELENPDHLYVRSEHFDPPGSDFSKAIGRIYSTRSKHTHEAVPFPAGIGIGTSHQIPFKELPVNMLDQTDIPAASWFERVVSIAARKFILIDNPYPFVEA